MEFDDPYGGTVNTQDIDSAYFGREGSETNFCALEYARVAVSRGTLFVDGGLLKVFPEGHEQGNIARRTNDQLVQFDLSRSHTTSSFSTKLLSKSNTNIPRTGFGDLIPLSSGSLYIIGGRTNGVDILLPESSASSLTESETPRAPSRVGKWVDQGTGQGMKGAILKYDTSKAELTWTQLPLTGDKRLSYGSAGVYADGNTIFYTGGAYVDDADLSKPGMPIGGLLKIDPEALRAQNSTLPNRGEKVSLGGFSTFLPLGEEGILVNFGGREYRTDGSGESKAVMKSMSDISVYDVASETWYTQEASGGGSGGIPGARANGCSVLAEARDKSSWNIYVFGGRDMSKSEVFADVWVLSLPSFTWVQVGKGDPRYPSVYPSCAASGRFMFSVGAINPNREDACHPYLSIFDMSSGQWKTEFSPNTRYDIPPQLYSVIGGFTDGGATKRSPTRWSNQKLSDIFTGKIKFSKSANSPTNNSGSTTIELTNIPPSSDASSSDSSSGIDGKTGLSSRGLIGVIAGAAITGIFLVGLAFFLLYRRKKRKLEQHLAKLASLADLESHAGSRPPSPRKSPRVAVGPIFGGGSGGGDGADAADPPFQFLTTREEVPKPPSRGFLGSHSYAYQQSRRGGGSGGRAMSIYTESAAETETTGYDEEGTGTMMTGSSDLRSNVSYSIDGRRYVARKIRPPQTPVSESFGGVHPGTQVFFGDRLKEDKKKKKGKKKRGMMKSSWSAGRSRRGAGSTTSGRSRLSLAFTDYSHPDLPAPHHRPPSIMTEAYLPPSTSSSSAANLPSLTHHSSTSNTLSSSSNSNSTGTSSLLLNSGNQVGIPPKPPVSPFSLPARQLPAPILPPVPAYYGDYSVFGFEANFHPPGAPTSSSESTTPAASSSNVGILATTPASQVPTTTNTWDGLIGRPFAKSPPTERELATIAERGEAESLRGRSVAAQGGLGQVGGFNGGYQGERGWEAEVERERARREMEVKRGYTDSGYERW